MSLLSELVTRIVADNSQFNRETLRSEKRIESFGKRMKRLEGQLRTTGRRLTTFVTLPIIGISTAMVKAASSMTESLNAVNVVFGESGKVITDWSRTAAGQVGLSAVEINKAATEIGALLINMGVAADDAAQEAIQLTRRAADMASVFDTDVKDALNAVVSGLQGQSRPLRRYAVNLLDTSVQAHALANGIADGTAELTEQEKLLGRISLLYEQTAVTEGDFEKTNDTFANSLRTLGAQLSNIGVTLGEHLIPTLTDFITTLRTLVTGFESLGPAGQRAILIMGGIAAAAGPLILAMITLRAAVGGVGAALVTLAAAGAAFGVYTALKQHAAAAAQAQFALNEQLIQFRRITNEDIRATIDALQKQIAANESAIADLGTVTAASSREAQRQLHQYTEGIREAREQIEILEAKLRTTALTPPSLGGGDDENPYAVLDEQSEDFYDREIARLNRDREIRDRLLRDRIAAEADANRQILEDAEAAAAAQIALERQRFDALLDGIRRIGASIGDVFSGVAERRLQESTRSAREELAQLEELGELTEEQAARKKELQEEIDAAQRQFQREEAKRQKAFAIFDAIIGTAAAIVQSLRVDPFGILAAINAAIGAAQIAAIAAQPLPELATGGVYSGRAVVGEGGGAELALPLTDYRALTQITDAFHRALDLQAQSQSGGGGDFTGDVILDGERVGKVMGRLARNGQMLIAQRAIVR